MLHDDNPQIVKSTIKALAFVAIAATLAITALTSNEDYSENEPIVQASTQNN